MRPLFSQTMWQCESLKVESWLLHAAAPDSRQFYAQKCHQAPASLRSTASDSMLIRQTAHLRPDSWLWELHQLMRGYEVKHGPNRDECVPHTSVTVGWIWRRGFRNATDLLRESRRVKYQTTTKPRRLLMTQLSHRRGGEGREGKKIPSNMCQLTCSWKIRYLDAY